MCEGDGGEVATAGGRDDDHQHPRRDPRVGGRVRGDAEEAVGHRVAGSGRPLCQLYLLDCRGHRGHARRQRHAGMFGRSLLLQRYHNPNPNRKQCHRRRWGRWDRRGRWSGVLSHSRTLPLVHPHTLRFNDNFSK